MLEVIDLVSDPRSELWQSTLDFIKTETGDRLVDNYINIDFSQFISFPCVLIDGNIACFSGLQFSKSRWGENIARCSSRMWVHPDYRHQGLTKFSGGDKFLNTTHCMPMQIKKAQEHGLSAIFVSRERNPLGFKKYLDLIKINCNLNFVLKPHRYNVCGGYGVDSESCSQHVAVHCLTDQGSDAWRISMLKYIIAE